MAFLKRCVSGLGHFLVEHNTLAFTMAAFVLAVLFINPIRDTPLWDDWSYARSAEHILNTGVFRLHEWNCANTVFHAYWGALFSLMLGYSFSTLRISTLFLALGGLLAFYELARLHKLSNSTAGVLTLVMLSGPLYLMYAFSFMTDVPFVTLMTMALLFYTRAVRRNSYGDMFVGSLISVAAILTRQIGIALPVGLFFLWLLNRDLRKDKALVLIGLALPVAAGLYQTWFSLGASHWCAEATRISQDHLFSNILRLIGELVWRPTATLHYLALFSMPLLITVFLATVLPSNSRTRRITLMGRERAGKATWQPSVLTFAVVIYVFIGIVLGDVCDFAYHGDLLMPYLPEIALQVIKRSGWIGRTVLTTITTLGAIVFLRIFLNRYLDGNNWAEVSPGQRFLDVATLCLFLLTLIFHAFSDRYLIALVPYALIVFAREFEPMIARLRTAAIIACVITLVASAQWVRTTLTYRQALWKGAEHIEQSAKVPPNRIDAGWDWLAYHDFDSFLTDARQRGVYSWDDFKSWQHNTRAKKEFRVSKYLPKKSEKSEWEIIGEIPYDNFFLRKKKVYLLRKRMPPEGD